MSNTIKLKRGTGSDPSASDLVVGEVALRTDSGQLFTKKDDGTLTEIGAAAGVSDGDKGDITVSNSGDTFTIDSGVINNAKIASNAAIAGSKITPTFTGNLTCGHLSASVDGNTSISLQDTGHGFPASEIKLSNGGRDLNIVAPKDIRLFPQSGELGLVVEANGQVELYFDNLKKAETSSTGFDVTGNITATGTIGSSNITITNSQPFLSLQDSDHENDFEVGNAGGLFRIRDVDAAVNRLTIASDGTTTISSNLDVGAGLDVTGNLTISNSLPQIKLTDTDNNPDYALWNHDGVFRIVDASNSNATRFQIQQGGLVVVSNGFQVTGVITGTSHIDIPDNAKIKLGTDDDLNIFHDGSNGQIQNTTGNLVIETPILHVKTTGNPTLLLEDTDQSNQVGVRYKTTTLDWIAGLHGGINQWKISKSTAFGTNDYFILDASGNLAITNNITLGGTVDGVDIAARNTLFGGLTSSSGVLTNGVTATTQSAGDNSTKLATTAYTDTAISNLVDSSPSTLNTLNELAAALGDDANFSTTVTNSIATKLPLAGGTLTGNLTIEGVTPELIFNDTTGSPDYKIRKQSGHFMIMETGQTNDTEWRFSIRSGGTINIPGNLDVGAGIDVTGDITSTGNLTISNTAPRIVLNDTDTDSDFRIQVASGNFRIQDVTNGNANRLSINSGGTVNIAGNLDVGAGIDVTGNIDITDGTLIIDTNPNSPNTSYGLQEAIRIDDAGSTADRALNIYEYHQGGARFFSLNFNLASGSTGSAYTYTQGNYGGSTMLQFGNNGTYRFYVDSQVSGGSQDVITPTERFKIDTTGVEVTGTCTATTFSGSGASLTNVNATTLDSLDSTQFIRSDADDTATGALTFSRELTFSNDNDGVFTYGGGRFYKKSGTGVMVRLHNANTPLQVENNSGTVLGTFFHTGNDGAGSGLDADTLDGQQGSYYADAASYVKEIRTKDDITTRLDSGFYESATATTAEGWPVTTNSWYHLIASTHSNTSNYYSMQIAGNFFSQGEFYIRSTQNSGTQAWSEIWTSSSDGSGSGLDADTVDGLHASSFIRSDANDTATGDIEFTGHVRIVTGDIDNTNTTKGLMFDAGYENGQYRTRIRKDDKGGGIPLYIDSSEGTANSYTAIARFGGYTNNTEKFEVFGTAKATTFSGSGASLTNIPAGQLTGTIADARIPDTITPATLVSTVEVRTSNGQQLVLNAGESNGKVSGQTGEYIYVNAEQGLSVNTPDSANANWIGGSASDQTVIKGTSITIDGNTVFHQGNDGSGSGLDSDTVDGIQASSFLRSDADDVATKRIRFENNVTDNEDDMATSTGNLGCIEIKNTGAGNDAFMAFHAGNDYAFYLGVNADSNCLAVGGWSMGAVKNKIWHQGNDGSGSGLDSDKLDGQEGSYYRNATNLNAGTVNKSRLPSSMNGTTFTGDLRVDNDADLRIGDGAANERILIQKADNNVSDHIIFYNGTTRIGEIGCHDNTWLRINQVTNKNIYTPRYIRADAGFFVDGTSKGINGSGNFIGGTIAGASDYGTLIRSNANDTVTGHTEWQDSYSVRLGNGADMRLYHNGSNSYIDNHTGSLYLRNAGTNDNANIYIQARDGENSIICEDDADVRLFSDNTEVFRTDTTSSCKVKHLYPWTNNAYDLGSTSLRWRNLYVQDMHFHNGEENPNKVDGTWGDWTLQEGENDIFMINNRSGKKFKIAMIPV